MATKKSAPAKQVEQRVITTICPKCGSEKQARGITWNDLADAGIATGDEAPIERKCSQCTYRETYRNKPMTEEQKAKRKAYNERRRAEIKEALELMKTMKEQGEA